MPLEANDQTVIHFHEVGARIEGLAARILNACDGFLNRRNGERLTEEKDQALGLM